MRAVAKAKILAAAFKAALAATPKHTPIPMLANLKVAVGDATITITGTDLDIEHTVTIPVTDFEPGAVTVPGKRVADLLVKLPPDAEVTLKTTEAGRCNITCERNKWWVPTLPEEDFPSMQPPGPEAASFTLVQGQARRLPARTAHAICDDGTWFYLIGVHLYRENNHLTATSTNGHRLARIAIPINPRAPVRVIVPALAVRALAELAELGDVEVAIDDRKITLASGNRVVISKLIDGTFPRTDHVIPEASKNKITIARTDLLAAVEQHVAVSGSKRPVIGLTWSNGGPLTCVHVGCGDAAVAEIAAIQCSGQARVGLSAVYLIDALKAIDSRTIVIDYAGGAAAVRFTNPDEAATVMVIMPATWPVPVVSDQPEPPTRAAPARAARGK